MRLPSLFLVEKNPLSEKAGSSHHAESAMVTSVLVPSSVGSMGTSWAACCQMMSPVLCPNVNPQSVVWVAGDFVGSSAHLYDTL